MEALRLVSIVTTRYRGFNYHAPPDWLDEPRSMYGASPDVRGLDLDSATVFYSYNDPPAIVEARFSKGESARIFIGPNGKVHASLLDRDNVPVRTRTQANGLRLPRVAILPQPGPVAKEETILTRDYVLGALDSPLAPTHFRNQLHLLYDYSPNSAESPRTPGPVFAFKAWRQRGSTEHLYT